MQDSDGNECDLPVLCMREPGWAANRIQALTSECDRLRAELTLSRAQRPRVGGAAREGREEERWLVMEDSELCAGAAAQEIERGGEQWDAERAGLVERVARVIAQYPDGGDWRRANATQRRHYESLAQRVIAMVTTEVIGSDAVAGVARGQAEAP